jgi:hypothetical protein
MLDKVAGRARTTAPHASNATISLLACEYTRVRIGCRVAGGAHANSCGFITVVLRKEARLDFNLLPIIGGTDFSVVLSGSSLGIGKADDQREGRNKGLELHGD